MVDESLAFTSPSPDVDNRSLCYMIDLMKFTNAGNKFLRKEEDGTCVADLELNIHVLEASIYRHVASALIGSVR